MRDIWVKGWMLGVRRTIVDRALEYRQMFGTLQGFRPEIIQRTYVPGENVGRAGKPIVRKILLAMGEEAGLKEAR